MDKLRMLQSYAYENQYINRLLNGRFIVLPTTSESMLVFSYTATFLERNGVENKSVFQFRMFDLNVYDFKQLFSNDTERFIHHLILNGQASALIDNNVVHERHLLRETSILAVLDFVVPSAAQERIESRYFKQLIKGQKPYEGF